MKKIKVLIVDDSAVMRRFLTDIISSSPKLEVVGTAIDPYFAVKKIKKFDPDVLTLDVEMPRMDGLTFLEKLMISHPLPVVMVSVFTKAGSEQTIKALQLGAVDFILKPKFQDISEKKSLLEFSKELIKKIIVASESRIKRKNSPHHIFTPKNPGSNPTPTKASHSVIAIGASTGGVEAISEIIPCLHENTPAILIAQHMPEKFTESFAQRLNDTSKVTVKEAKDGDRLLNGSVFIAPGNRHMVLDKDNEGYLVRLNNGELVNRQKPSVDVLFRSVAEIAEDKAIGIILSGMGSDGARGLLEMKETGAVTIAQDKNSSIVFGMPMKAIELNAATLVKNLDEITMYINNLK
ncbi:MAG: chemotaxis response regulator protein-glutamate methylesterase [bacterium]|nr:chemotaxis response regulator protein-glutamate methylesterase [bacterium]